MNKCLIVFSHSNYIVKSTGTEKCIRELTNVLLNQGVVTIQVFSMYNRYSRVFGNQLIGVNFNNEFIGIYQFKDLGYLVSFICKKHDLHLVGSHLHHLLNFDLIKLQEVLISLQLPVTLFIHDYYTVCPSINMIDSRGEFCGVSFPSNEKCIHCSYYLSAQKFDLIRKFLEGIYASIFSVIVPSDDVFGRWVSVYQEFKHITHVRGHLLPQGCYEREYIEGQKIKIAFVGLQLDLKGYKDWVTFADAQLEKDKPYELHYFGEAKHHHPSVSDHVVSTAAEGKDAMITSLRKNNIDFVFLWSQCPETYSYVYYEASAAGAVIITNPKSGNIAKMVDKMGNGIVLANIEQVINIFSDVEAVTRLLKSKIEKPPFAPDHLETNPDIMNLLHPSRNMCRLPVVNKGVKPSRLYSYLYTRIHNISLCKV